MSQTYGTKLSPYRKLREPYVIKGIRTIISLTHNPSRIDQNQTLTVNFPNLGSNDLIIPKTTQLGFNIVIDSADPNATLVNNLGRSIVKTIIVKLDNTGVFTLTNADQYCI